MRFEVIEGKTFHCGAIARRLREEHAEAVRWLGLRSHEQIRAAFDDSAFRRAWLIDGRLAGLGGVAGPLMATEGHIWLALTAEAVVHPVAAAREARRQIEEILQTKHRLYTTLIPHDRAALRFATRLGFEVDSPTPVPVGRGHVIRVSYSRAAAQAA